ncbi:MAG TPA: IS630 family transposase [Pseudonocardiaceae bacterium]|jgi:transposase|nr:IS630 family transposase [Pseudonocardiaceae bacterium]
MADEDTRSLPAAAQAALRTRAVRAVLEGMTQAEAARVFRVHPNAGNRWSKRDRAGGWAGLAEQRRGRRPGEQAALADPQQQEVIALVRDSTPDQLGLAGFLWTREAVAELIARRYGVGLARTTVGGYLRGWGCSPQRPQRRALEQNPAAVRRWLAETYPAIRALAKREGGVVLWLDEMGVRSDAAAGRSWAPVGQTPVINGTGKRFRVNMISAISNAGMLRFRLFTGSFTAAVLIDFLRRLLCECGGRKVHLIVDGHPVHRAKAVSAWLGRHADRIELHFLPGYSPALNPVELLHHDVKANAAGRRRPRSAAELRGELRDYLRQRQRQPAVLVRFFQHPSTRYAAAS